MLRKSIVSLIIVCCILLTGCKDNSLAESNSNHNNDKAMIIIDGETIWYSEFEQTRERYKLQSELSDVDLIEGIVLEAIVLGMAETYDVNVAEEEVNAMFEGLASLDESGLFYNKALEIYGTDDKIKEAYYYGILYDKVQEKIRENFAQGYSINENILEMRANDYVLQYELADNEKEEFTQAVRDAYETSMQSELFDLYFKVWQYKQIDKVEIEYVDLDRTSFFQKFYYGIDTKNLNYKDEIYELEEWTFSKCQEVFGNILYLSNSVQIDFDDIEIMGVHKPAKNVKAIYIKMEKDLSEPIIITVVVSPCISLNYEERGWIMLKSVEGSRNKIDLINNNYGIHYSISSEKGYNELEILLYEFISIDLDK